ncbi:MAG: hypothetical protein B9S33_18550 [Pedosphaera sp. Tous-C6FEB]|nr:MAG: hypothetical protein B9S33_18550 [Pedosphaera sp. Tous-C6FEB]
MERRFSKHYSLAEARELLPQIRGWLHQLQRVRRDLTSYEQSTHARLNDGDEFGGGKVHQWIRNLSAFKEILEEFERREIQLKDIERGLVDFPAIQAGREVFLCWELAEADITHWHDLQSGFDGREHL